MNWTDEKERSVRVVSGGGKCSVWQLQVPSQANKGQFVKITFVCHVDSGNVHPCLAIENCSGNPGDIIVKAGNVQRRVSPGTYLYGCVGSQMGACSTYSFGDTEIMFEKEGTYTLKFMAGHSP